MKLEPGERSILAYFKAWEPGHEAVVELQRNGFGEVQIDLVDRFGFDPGADRRRPALSGEGTSLAASVLYGHEGTLGGDDSEVLLAATPQASGMSDPGTNEGFNVLVTVLTSERRVDEAVEILKRFGAQV